MAKQWNGYMGGFSGKLGPAIGYQWNGMWCVRAHQKFVNNPRTEEQQSHRACFAEEVRLAARMARGVRAGLTSVARECHMTARNLFMRINQPAFTESGGTLEVDYSQLKISVGPVAPVSVTSATLDADGVLKVKFEGNMNLDNTDSYDSVYFYAYSPEAGRGYLFAPVYRYQHRAAALLPTELKGFDVHVYAFVGDAKDRMSETSYGGYVEAVGATTSAAAPATGAAARIAAEAESVGMRGGVDVRTEKERVSDVAASEPLSDDGGRPPQLE